jgi:hypothetical protein
MICSLLLMMIDPPGWLRQQQDLQPVENFRARGVAQTGEEGNSATSMDHPR